MKWWVVWISDVCDEYECLNGFERTYIVAAHSEEEARTMPIFVGEEIAKIEPLTLPPLGKKRKPFLYRWGS